MKNKRFPSLFAAVFIILSVIFSVSAYAEDLDEIERYEIKIDVNEDATLSMLYEIDWRVLDSTSDGPLSWVKIGIPNAHYVSYEALGDNISDISYTSSGGSYLKITFDQSYYEGEVVKFSFLLTQDYMYDMDSVTEGYTVYTFTPGWFDDIKVDSLVIRWNSDKADSFSPACETDSEGYYVWRTALSKGERYTVRVTYANDAYAFVDYKSTEKDDGGDGYDYTEDDGNSFADFITGLFVLPIMLAPFALPIVIGSLAYRKTANFNTQKKITRTKIEYYPECQGCGAPRPEGRDNCEYCGRSFIKSETKVEEKDIPKGLRARKSLKLHVLSP